MTITRAILVLALVTMAASVDRSAANGCDALKGEWKWFTKGTVVFQDDHTILYNGQPMGRTW